MEMKNNMKKCSSIHSSSWFFFAFALRCLIEFKLFKYMWLRERKEVYEERETFLYFKVPPSTPKALRNIHI